MTENAAKETSADETGAEKRSRPDLGPAVAGGLRTGATLFRIVTLVFAAVLVVHVVLSVAAANPDHPVTAFFRDFASRLTLGLDALFVPANATLALVVNLGLAAVVWIVIGVVVAKLLHAVASAVG